MSKIPKILHYCWFGHGLMPQSQSDFIHHWMELMPDWQVIRWDESNFPVNYCPYTDEAYRRKKWAFVSDVARLKALSEMGGVYLDTDVELFGSLEPYLDNRLFSGVELYPDDFNREGRPLVDAEGKPHEDMLSIPYCGFLSAVLGAEPHHPLVEECLGYYRRREALTDQGDLNSIVIDGVLAMHAVKYGFRYTDRLQQLPEMTLYPSKVFSYAGAPSCKEAVAFHHTAWSWMPQKGFKRLFSTLDKLHLLKPYRKFKEILRNIFH